jgi:hypothetical protein
MGWRDELEKLKSDRKVDCERQLDTKEEQQTGKRR